MFNIIGIIFYNIERSRIWNSELQYYGIEKYGKCCSGLIIDMVEGTNRRGSPRKYAKYIFSPTKTVSYSGATDDNKIVKMNIGDSVDIIYHELYPKICMVKIEFDNSKKSYYFGQKYFNPLSDKFFIRSMFK